MILGNIKDFVNFEDIKLSYGVSSVLASYIEQALNALKDKNAGDKFIILENKVFASVEEHDTYESNERYPEYHKDFLDVHIVLSGDESIGFRPLKLTDTDIVKEEYDNKKDLGFVENKNINYVNLFPGNFAVFYPLELHKPLCKVTNQEHVKKIILKVHKTLL